MSEQAEERVEQLWMTTKELAAYLKLAPGTISNWVSAGAIPCHKIRGCVRFDRNVIEEWIRSGAATLPDKEAVEKEETGNHETTLERVRMILEHAFYTHNWDVVDVKRQIADALNLLRSESIVFDETRMRSGQRGANHG